MSAGSLTREQVLDGNYAAAHFTPEQGRVLFHQDRLFRSTGGGLRAHDDYVAACAVVGLPSRVDRWSLAQCIQGLRLIERACRGRGLHLFRDVRTQWEPIADKLWAHAPEECREALSERGRLRGSHAFG